MVRPRLALRSNGTAIDWYILVPATRSLVCLSPCVVPTAQSTTSSTYASANGVPELASSPSLSTWLAMGYVRMVTSQLPAW